MKLLQVISDPNLMNFSFILVCLKPTASLLLLMVMIMINDQVFYGILVHP